MLYGGSRIAIVIGSLDGESTPVHVTLVECWSASLLFFGHIEIVLGFGRRIFFFQSNPTHGGWYCYRLKFGGFNLKTKEVELDEAYLLKCK